MNQQGRTGLSNARRWLIFAPIVVAVGIVVLIATRRSDGPSYAGRSADDWLKGLAHFKSGSDPEKELRTAVMAFENMGSNGIAFLLTALEERDSAIIKIYLGIHTNLPSVVSRHLPVPTLATMKGSWAQVVLARMDDPHPEVTFGLLTELLSSKSAEARLFAAILTRTYVEKYRRIDLLHFRPVLVSALSATNDNGDAVGLFAKGSLVESLCKAGLGCPELTSVLQPLLASTNSAVRGYAQQIVGSLTTVTTPVNTNAP